MKKFTLTVLDTTGIQNYIFGSNNLKHNVGASGLVHWATHDWVYDKLIKLGASNVKNIDGKFDNQIIEKDDLNSELVYSGGGNTVIIFKTHDLAKDFAKLLTRKVLSEAPGLQLVVTHTDFDWDANKLSDIVLSTIRDLNKKKHNRVFSSPLLGLGVTADCQYTGLPATELRLESRKPIKKVRISSEISAKLDSFESANERLKDVIEIKEGFEFISNFNDFGVKHSSSYIGVVHADGNGIGKRVMDISNQSKDSRDYIKNIRLFSKSVEETTTKALQASAYQLLESVDEYGKIGGIVEIQDNKLPFRPIVFGGDDVTFVCDGRLGLTLAEFYLTQLTSQSLSDEQPIFARAGVTVVKSHYPFSRAVALSEELAKSAKEYILKSPKPSGVGNLSAIDWHFASTGPIGNITSIRKREYTVQSGILNMRPLRLGKSEGSDWHSWETFTTIMKEFQGEKWVDRKNKIMALRETLASGPEAVKQFVTAYKLDGLPEIPGNEVSKTTGWIGNCCTCFDAIEAIDFFVPIDGGRK